MSGFNPILFYATTIFGSAGVDEDHVQYAVLGITAAMIVFTIIAIPLMDRAGRRGLLIIPIAIMIVCLVVYTISMCYIKPHPQLAWLAIVMIIVYIAAYSVGIGPVPWLICAEIFPQAARPKAMMMSIWVQCASSFVSGMTFEYLDAVCHPYTFLIYTGVLVISFVFVIALVPETRNKPMEQIVKEMQVPLGAKGRRAEDRGAAAGGKMGLSQEASVHPPESKPHRPSEAFHI